MTFQLIFTRRFSMAHRLISGKSIKCAVPHGHNEYITVKVESFQDLPLDGQVNMMEPFEKIKKTWHHFIDEKIDHSFQLSHKDPLINYFRENEPDKLDQIVITPGDPTTEMLCACLMAKLQTILDNESDHLICSELTIEETPTNKVSLIGARAYEKHLRQLSTTSTDTDLSKQVNDWWYQTGNKTN